MQPISIHCSNVAGIWIGSLQSCENAARIVSPYLTSRLVNEAVQSDFPHKVEIHTRFDIEAFVCGASSLATLRRLFDDGFPLFDVPRLHAKIFEHPDGFATIGSQNLTQRGTRNRESSVVIRKPALLKTLKLQLDRWVIDRRPITLEMIADAEAAIIELKPVYRALRRKCGPIEREIFAAQAERNEAARLAAEEDERKRKEQEGEQDEANRLSFYQEWRDRRLAKLGGVDRVPREACEDVARKATNLWINGRLSDCSGDADYLYEIPPHGLAIPLGSNKFGVELAIILCREKLREFISEPGFLPFFTPLTPEQKTSLEACVCESIIKHDDTLFGSSYPVDNGWLKLGNHWVSPPRTVAAILEYAGLT